MATIYIVEDDVNIREIERYALKNSGYEVEEFESGESLFKRLERAVSCAASARRSASGGPSSPVWTSTSLPTCPRAAAFRPLPPLRC